MYELISHQRLLVDSAEFNFTNIPQNGTDLILLTSLRATNTVSQWQNVRITFNDSSTGYNYRLLYGNDSGVFTDSQSSQPHFRFHYSTYALATAGVFASGQIHVQNYTSSNAKSIAYESATEHNGSAAIQGMSGGFWTGTSPVTSIKIVPDFAGNFVAGSSVSLYKLNRTSALGKQKAMGGFMQLKNGYWYHTFTGSGTFTAFAPIQAEILAVAGGGSAGYDWAAGGGAGGVQYLANASIAASSYAVTVGSGGAGSTGGGANGNNSSFASTVIAIGGGRGGSLGTDGASGGSGGGGNQFTNRLGGAAVAGTGGVFLGNKGGNGLRGPSGGTQEASAGGGGAGGEGQSGYSSGGYFGGNGGVGTTAFSDWGLATGTGHNVNGIVYYAGGGGGAGRNGSGVGGLGGGGSVLPSGQDGLPTTGGGAGGDAKSGGSGVVIIRYPA